IVEKSGSWYSYEDERIGQGRENARKFLKEHPDLRERMADAIYTSKGLKRQVAVTRASRSDQAKKGEVAEAGTGATA
ncbi:MAG: hypothetical protein V3T28_04335, partial [Gemmatimonadales bacterium]